MIKPKSIIIGICITIILIKLCNYYLFESELLSSLIYIVTFSYLYEMISKYFKKEEKVVEGYSTTNKKEVQFLPFEPSNTFNGKKNGYVFKKGDKGLGYYLDG